MATPPVVLDPFMSIVNVGWSVDEYYWVVGGPFERFETSAGTMRETILSKRFDPPATLKAWNEIGAREFVFGVPANPFFRMTYLFCVSAYMRTHTDHSNAFAQTFGLATGDKIFSFSPPITPERLMASGALKGKVALQGLKDLYGF